MVFGLTPARPACGTWANHSYWARQSLAVTRIANSESRGGTPVLNRQWPPNRCASSPKAGACRNAANGPRIVVLLPRGPERIDWSSARWAGASWSSLRTGSRGGAIFLADFFAGIGLPSVGLADTAAAPRPYLNSSDLIMLGTTIVGAMTLRMSTQSTSVSCT